MADPVTIAGILGFVGGAATLASAWWWRARDFRTACRSALADDVDPDLLPPELAALIVSRNEDVDAVRRGSALALRIAEEQASRATRIVESLDDPVILLDAEGAVVDRNAAAAALAGRIRAEGAVPLESIVRSRSAAREIRDLARGLFNAAEATVRRTAFMFLDGNEERDFEVSIRRLDDTGRVLVVLHETTREHEIARIKSEFVAKASHELRTPLASIRATLELLEEGDLEDPEARTEMLSIATEEADRLARLVDDMLDISRIEAGVARPTIEEVDLGTLAIEVVEGLRAAAERRDLEIEVRVEGEGLVVEGDRGMLSTVIGNLAGNAVKYVPDGERITVEVAPDDLTRSVVVTVTDTGLGIPPDDLPRIFEKFYRVQRYERRARGTGLGLDLCRNIVEQVHRGRIGVDSRLGEGARFWFGVPASHASSMAA